MDNIRGNLAGVLGRMDAAAKKSGRDSQDITLVAVSKFVGPERMLEAYNAGIRHFGENHAQAVRDKFNRLPSDCCLHFIGRLQQSKIKYLVGKTRLIQSIDSLRQVAEISRRATAAGLSADLLLQINPAGELQKGGVPPGEAEAFVATMLSYPNVRPAGLMMIPPQQPFPEENRRYFSAANVLFHRLRDNFAGADNILLEYLSMGMSNDYTIAIEEGANMVRVGSAVFGSRRAG